MSQTGAWGPVARGGPGRRWPRLLLAAALSVGVAAAGATASFARLTLDAVTQNIERAEVANLDPPPEPNEPLHVLVVGSDGRDGLTDEERRELSLGSFDGQRSDTVLLVSISADRQDVSLVSFPRDLVVDDVDGGIAKLTETYTDGREALVESVRSLGFPVNHYVEVSITGFIDTVEILGEVEICLDEPLRDRRAGIDLPEGCQELDPPTALGFVRSRADGGDFKRIERQQIFLRAMLSRILGGDLLTDPGRLVAVAEDVSSNLTVDEGLGVGQMVELAQEMRSALSGEVTMITVPGFTRKLDDGGVSKDFVVAYGPGLDSLSGDVQSDVEPPTRGTPDERDETSVLLWTHDEPAAAAIVESTLAYGGFGIGDIRTGDPAPTGDTVVHPVPGFEEHADWIAAHIGADVEPLPVGIEVPDGRTAIVSIGTDSVTFASLAPGGTQG